MFDFSNVYFIIIFLSPLRDYSNRRTFIFFFFLINVYTVHPQRRFVFSRGFLLWTLCKIIYECRVCLPIQ